MNRVNNNLFIDNFQSLSGFVAKQISIDDDIIDTESILDININLEIK